MKKILVLFFVMSLGAFLYSQVSTVEGEYGPYSFTLRDDGTIGGRYYSSPWSEKASAFLIYKSRVGNLYNFEWVEQYAHSNISIVFSSDSEFFVVYYIGNFRPYRSNINDPRSKLWIKQPQKTLQTRILEN